MSEQNFVALRFPAQDPDAIDDYRLEFDEYQASLPVGVSIVGVSWVCIPIADDDRPLVLVASANAPDFAYSDVRLMNGSLHFDYRVQGTISLSDGQVDKRSFMLEIGYT